MEQKEDPRTQGFFRNVAIPRSSIYVSSSGMKEAEDKVANKKKYKFESNVTTFHFFLILRAGVHYTEEDIQDCQGKYSCHNCGRKIMGPIYFYPEEFDCQTNDATCSPIPHCRVECVYRTLQDMKNNADLLTNFFLLYGHDITCAPERFLLVIPGGLNIEAYHKAIDDKLIIQQHPSYIRGCFGPVFISSTLFQNHQLVPDTVAFLDEMTIVTKNTIGPSRNRDNSDLKVVELAPKKLIDTKLAEVFSFEPTSFDRNADLSANPHMK